MFDKAVMYYLCCTLNVSQAISICFAGVLVCLALILVLVGAIGFIIWRVHHRKARQEEVNPGDEEEGLIKMSADGEADLGDDNNLENGAVRSKLRQGRRPGKLLASVETLDEYEDEGNYSHS